MSKKLADRTRSTEWEKTSTLDAADGSPFVVDFEWCDIEGKHVPFAGDKVTVKQYGCIHYSSHSVNDDEPDYIHICDLDAFIAQLQDLKAKAIAEFGAEWGAS